MNQYKCERCNRNHKMDSNIGKAHFIPEPEPTPSLVISRIPRQLVDEIESRALSIIPLQNGDADRYGFSLPFHEGVLNVFGTRDWERIFQQYIVAASHRFRTLLDNLDTTRLFVQDKLTEFDKLAGITEIHREDCLHYCLKEDGKGLNLLMWFYQ